MQRMENIQKKKQCTYKYIRFIKASPFMIKTQSWKVITLITEKTMIIQDCI